MIFVVCIYPLKGEAEDSTHRHLSFNHCCNEMKEKKVENFHYSDWLENSYLVISRSSQIATAALPATVTCASAETSGVNSLVFHVFN